MGARLIPAGQHQPPSGWQSRDTTRPLLACCRYEADDVIASLSAYASKLKLRVVVTSKDSDMQSLIGKGLQSHKRSSMAGHLERSCYY